MLADFADHLPVCTQDQDGPVTEFGPGRNQHGLVSSAATASLRVASSEYRRVLRQRHHQVVITSSFSRLVLLSSLLFYRGISTRFDRVELDFKEVNLGTPAVVYHRAWARSRDWCRQRRVMGLQEAFFGG
jgi:hypothetical protein